MKKIFSKIKNAIKTSKEDKAVAIMAVSASAATFVQSASAGGELGKVSKGFGNFKDWLIDIVNIAGWVVAVIGVAILAYAFIAHAADQYSRGAFCLIGGVIMIIASSVINVFKGGTA